MRRARPHACRLALCALACLLGAGRAHAAWWLVPAGPQTPSTIATTLGRAQVESELGAVSAGLNAAFALRGVPRLVDLQSGVVRPLGAGALQGLVLPRNGELQTLERLLALPGVVLVVDLDAPTGPVLQVISNDGQVDGQPLAQEQTALLGELPCATGYAPVSFAFGTRCEDVDECAAGLDECDAHASCDNDVGGYDCKCDDGYEGDGRECEQEDEGGGGEEGGEGGSDAPDAGPGDSSDAGTPDAGGLPTEDAGTPDTPDSADAGDGGSNASDGGCDCSVRGAGPSAFAHPIVLPLAWLLWRRRRPRT